MKIHPESYLNIPLVRQLFNDPNISFSARAVDNNWFYEGHFKDSIGGFNPLMGTIFYSQTSQFASWLKQKNESSRLQNFEDNLTYEVMFAVHDYLHAWTYQAIQTIMPQLKIGIAPITEKNFEDMVFCHLLSESAATVGSDYWYFSQVNLNDVISIGTTKETLAAKFHMKDLPEFRKFNRKFDPSTIEFFEFTNNLYAYSEIKGFSASALEKSPKILKWVKHEYKYGEVQRKLTREWLMSLAIEPIQQFKGKDLSQPLVGKQPWKKDLVQEIAKLLWQKVVEDKPIFFKKLKSVQWKPRTTASVYDYRFFNINSFGSDYWSRIENSYFNPDSHNRLFMQILSKFKVADLDPVEIEILLKMESNFNLKQIEYILRKHKPLQSKSNETAHLFLAG